MNPEGAHAHGRKSIRLRGELREIINFIKPSSCQMPRTSALNRARYVTNTVVNIEHRESGTYTQVKIHTA